MTKKNNRNPLGQKVRRALFLAAIATGAVWACAPLEPPEQRQEAPNDGYYDDYDTYDDHDIYDRESLSEREEE